MKTIGAVAFGACALVAIACGSAGPEATTSSTTASLSDSCDGGSATSDAGSSSLFACGGSVVGCVAVEEIDHCCTNGWKIAVNADEATAYEEENACSVEHRIHTPCPLYIVEDKRVPTCNTSTDTCEMVEPDAGPGDDGGIGAPLPIRF